jgi:hypothetical protein
MASSLLPACAGNMAKTVMVEKAKALNVVDSSFIAFLLER